LQPPRKDRRASPIRLDNQIERPVSWRSPLSHVAFASPLDYGSRRKVSPGVSDEVLPQNARASTRPTRQLARLATTAIVAAEVIFWLYTIYAIKQHTDLNGSGLEVIAMIPITGIALFLVLPALVLSFVRRALWFAFGLAVAAGAADIVVWSRTVREIARASGASP
jgi:hypothetical protein